MTSPWIVGVDGSDNSRHALEWAIDQAVGRDVRIVLLATWTAPLTGTGLASGGTDFTDSSAFERELLRSAEALASTATRDGVRLEARTAHGHAAPLLIEASRDAELLVIGARGLGRVEGVVLGSVSQRCSLHNTVPTAVIGDDAPLGPARRAVIGFDGSSNARTAVEWALRFVDRDAVLTIVDACTLAPALAEDEVRRRFPAEVDAAEAEFHAQMAELDPEGRAEHLFVFGDARLAIRRAAQDADLLVLGTRGQGGVGALLLGSTTTWMLHDASCASVVVPADPHED
jgi:nucleotide-binding universal stress UspA family protein